MQPHSLNKYILTFRDLYPGTTERPLPKVVRAIRSSNLKQEEIEKFNQKLQVRNYLLKGFTYVGLFLLQIIQIMHFGFSILPNLLYL